MKKSLAIIESDALRGCRLKELAQESLPDYYLIHNFSSPEEGQRILEEYDIVIFDYKITPSLYDQIATALNKRTMRMSRFDFELLDEKVNFVVCMRDKGAGLNLPQAFSASAAAPKQASPLQNQEYALNDVKISGLIDNIFSALGVKRNLMGTIYMTRAIKIVIEDFKIITHGITKILYPQLASEFETSQSKVERAIRHVIDVAFKARRFGVLDGLLGGCVFSDNYKPSNGEFIAFVADKILLKLKCEGGPDTAFSKIHTVINS